jgi:ribosomal protein S18 acetylase RimI-like enzyme
MQITIRRATAEDAALLAELNTEIQQMHADAVPKFFKEANAQNPALIADYARRLSDEHTYVFIAEVDSQAVGSMVLVHRQIDENPYAFAHTRLVMDQISVNASHRGKGVGHAFMEEAKALSKMLNVDYLALNVWAFNEQAIEFYKREGFENMALQMWQRMKD